MKLIDIFENDSDYEMRLPPDTYVTNTTINLIKDELSRPPVDYKEVVFLLDDLVVNVTTKKLPDLSKLLNQHKHGIIKSLLSLIRQELLSIVQNAIHAMQSANVNWPELAVIKKSLDHESINEGEMEDDLKDNLDGIVKEISNGYYNEALFIMHELPYFHPKLPNWAKFLNDHKHGLMKELLIQVKRSGAGASAAVVPEIECLRLFGCTWPEFDLILKSIEHDMLKEGVIDIPNESRYINQLINDIDDGAFAYTLHIMGIFGADIDKWPELKQCLERNRTAIVKYILTELTECDGNSIDNCNFVSEIVHSLMRIGIRWEELYTIDKSVSHEISKLEQAKYDNDERLHESSGVILKGALIDHAIKEAVKYFNQGHSGYGRGVLYLKSYGINVQDYPQLKEYFNSKKPAFLKNILSNFNTSDDSYASSIRYVLNLLFDLKRIGVDWLELDTIQTSATHEYKRLNLAQLSPEELDENINDNLSTEIDIFIDMLTDGDDGLSLLDGLDSIADATSSEHDVVYPNISGLLDKNKHSIVEALLKELLDFEGDGYPNNANQILRMIKTLRKFGVKWLELSIVEKSATFEHKRFHSTYQDPEPPELDESIYKGRL